MSNILKSNMKVAYARTQLNKSIFLAGPTPRSPDVKSWRPDAIDLLRDRFNFNGTVFVPEDADWSSKFTYDDQVEWELQALHSATVIVFWIPRQLETMPALTTNVEYGLFIRHRNIVIGAPIEAQKMTYLKSLAHLHDRPVHNTLEETLTAAVRMAERPFPTTKEQQNESIPSQRSESS